MNKIRVVARIERDVRNFFFVRMLYTFSELPNNLRTVYEITDKNLLAKIINLSHSLLCEANNIFSETLIVAYNVVEKQCTRSLYIARRVVPDIVIAGTSAQANFAEINYLLGLISNVMIRENLGEISVQHNGKNMSCNEFYNIQKNFYLY